MAEPETPRSAGRVAFTYPDFGRYLLARSLIIVALEMQSVAVGWQVYEITRRPLDLGLVGLAEFMPGVLFFLAAGHAADRFDRRNVLAWCYGGVAVCSALLLHIAHRGARSVHPIYAVLLLLGTIRCFYGPAGQALLPQLVAVEHFPNAVSWSASTRTTATIVGPALGGVIYAFFGGPSTVYAAVMVTAVAATFSTLRIEPRKKASAPQPVSWTTILAGLRYIWHHKLILGAVSLDLFAVLLGGAEALLPVYAREILHTGPWGLGLLRSAPGVGAAAMAALVAVRPLHRRAGLTMLWCVAGFGISTIVFGLSRNLPLSLLALLLVGASGHGERDHSQHHGAAGHEG